MEVKTTKFTNDMMAKGDQAVRAMGGDAYRFFCSAKDLSVYEVAEDSYTIQYGTRTGESGKTLQWLKNWLCATEEQRERLTDCETEREKCELQSFDAAELAESLYGGGWRAEDRDWLMAEYGLQSDEADDVADELRKLAEEG